MTESRLLAIFIGMFAGGYIENLVLSAMALVWEPYDIGLVSGLLCTLRTAGGALKTSIYSTILAMRLTRELPALVGLAAINAELVRTSLSALLEDIPTQTYDGIPGVDAKVNATPASLVYSGSFRTVWLTYGCLAIIAAYFTPNAEDYLTKDVARQLQGYAAESDVWSMEKG